jgi:DNA-binding MarR family transcriptional regulator
MIDVNLEEYAKSIAQLTFEMEKVCRTKEVLFCKSIDLTPIEFRCLRFLINNNFAQVKDLASNMDLTPSRVTTLLNSLEEKNYVKRDISNEDRRIIKVSLTSNGVEYTKNIQNKYIKFHEDILSSFENESKLQDIVCSLKSFQNTLEQFLENKKEK